MSSVGKSELRDFSFEMLLEGLGTRTEHFVIYVYIYIFIEEPTNASD
jgi:hypothetical protein